MKRHAPRGPAYDKPTMSNSRTSPAPPMGKTRNPKQKDSRGRGDQRPFGTQMSQSGERAPWPTDGGAPGRGSGDGAHRGGSPRSRKGRYEFG